MVSLQTLEDKDGYLLPKAQGFVPTLCGGAYFTSLEIMLYRAAKLMFLTGFMQNYYQGGGYDYKDAE